MPWSTLRSAQDIDEKTDVWSKFLKSCIDNHFPLRKKRIRKTTHPWLDCSILRLMRRRNHLHRHARESGDKELWSLYRQLRNNITCKLRKQRRDFFKTRLQEHRGDPKQFWKTLKLVLPGKTKAKNIDKLVTENELNSHFVSIADSVLKDAYPDTPVSAVPLVQVNTHSDTEFTFDPVTNEDVYKAFISLKTSKATGNDDIPARVLKVAAGQLAPSAAYLYNASWNSVFFLQTGKLPVFHLSIKGVR